MFLFHEHIHSAGAKRHSCAAHYEELLHVACPSSALYIRAVLLFMRVGLVSE